MTLLSTTLALVYFLLAVIVVDLPDRVNEIMSLSGLPNEVLDQILRYLSLSDLCTVSLLSRAWQARAFPLLYHTIYLPSKVLDNMKESVRRLARRIEMEDGSGALSVSASARRLVLHNLTGFDKSIELIISRLSALRHISWTTWMRKEDLAKVHLLQTRCPHLESVDLSVWGTFASNFASTLDLPVHRRGLTNLCIRFLTFTNLPHFSLSFDNSYLSYKPHLQCLMLLPSTCPNLASLVLNLNDIDCPTDYDDLILPDIFGILQGVSFPFLRKFHVLGYADPDWNNMFTKNGSYQPLRTFFAMNSGVEDLALISMPNYVGEGKDFRISVDPENMHKLFPRLKSFAGPSYLCRAIIQSRLAFRLDSLTISDPKLDEISETRNFSLLDVAESTTDLPRLRRLVIMARTRQTIPTRALGALLRTSVGLQELGVRSELDDPAEFYKMLQLLPNLRWLALRSPIQLVDPKADAGEREASTSQSGEWLPFIQKVATICPCLGVVRSQGSRGKTYYDEWVIRRLDGEVKVEAVGRSFGRFPAELYYPEL